MLRFLEGGVDTQIIWKSSTWEDNLFFAIDQVLMTNGLRNLFFSFYIFGAVDEGYGREPALYLS